MAGLPGQSMMGEEGPAIRGEDGRAALFPLSSPHLVLYSLGRYAIVGALQLLAFSGGEILLLPSFICRTVTDLLDRYGYRYRFYPVTRRAALDLEALAGSMTPDVRALLFVNYFGFPADCLELKSLCRAHGVTVIEDNAHGFLGKDRRGDPLGARGDIGIFSFHKTIYLPDGGGMVVNRPELAGGERGLLSAGARDVFQGSFLLKRRVRMGLELLGLERAVLGRLKRRKGEGGEETLPETRDISRISWRLLGRIEPDSALEFRRRSYQEALEVCEEEGFEPLYGGLEEGVCPYLLPVLAPPERSRLRVAARLEKMGYQVSHWPDLPANLNGGPGDAARWLRENLMAVYLRPALV